jgi:hypothetical protein
MPMHRSNKGSGASSRQKGDHLNSFKLARDRERKRKKIAALSKRRNRL